MNLYNKIIHLKCASNFISAYVFNLLAFPTLDCLILESLLLFKYYFFSCLVSLIKTQLCVFPSVWWLHQYSEQNQKVLNEITPKLSHFKICMKTKYFIKSISIVSWIFYFSFLIHNHGHIFIRISLIIHIWNLLHDIIIVYSKKVKTSAGKVIENTGIHL